MLLITFIISCAFATVSEDMNKFAQFKQEFKRNYANPAEEKLRFSLFQKSLRNVEKFNAERKRSTDAIFGINAFSDALPEELPQRNLQHHKFLRKGDIFVSGVVDYNSSRLVLPEGDNLPENLAYCSQYVSRNTDRIKVDLCGTGYDQGSCGSCYAASQANIGQYFYSNQSYMNGYGKNTPNFGIQHYLNQTKISPLFNCGNSRCCG